MHSAADAVAADGRLCSHVHASVDGPHLRAAFLRIGTNDLTSSTLGVDRFASGTARTDDPRVLAAIARTVDAAHEATLAVEVCGEAAADPVMLPLLLGLGVDELSAGAARVGALRAQIRSLSLNACRTAAHAALEGVAVSDSASQGAPARRITAQGVASA